MSCLYTFILFATDLQLLAIYNRLIWRCQPFKVYNNQSYLANTICEHLDKQKHVDMCCMRPLKLLNSCFFSASGLLICIWLYSVTWLHCSVTWTQSQAVVKSRHCIITMYPVIPPNLRDIFYKRSFGTKRSRRCHISQLAVKQNLKQSRLLKTVPLKATENNSSTWQLNIFVLLVI